MANGDAVSPEPVSYRSEGAGEGWGCSDFCPFGGVGGVRNSIIHVGILDLHLRVKFCKSGRNSGTTTPSIVHKKRPKFRTY